MWKDIKIETLTYPSSQGLIEQCPFMGKQAHIKIKKIKKKKTQVNRNKSQRNAQSLKKVIKKKMKIS